MVHFDNSTESNNLGCCCKKYWSKVKCKCTFLPVVDFSDEVSISLVNAALSVGCVVISSVLSVSLSKTVDEENVVVYGSLVIIP